MGFDFPICLFCFLPAFQGGFQNGPPRWFRSAGAPSGWSVVFSRKWCSFFPFAFLFAFLCILMHFRAFYCIFKALGRAAFYKSVTF